MIEETKKAGARFDCERVRKVLGTPEPGEPTPSAGDSGVCVEEVACARAVRDEPLVLEDRAGCGFLMDDGSSGRCSANR